MADQPENTPDLEVPADFEGLTDDDLRDLHSRLEARYTTDRPAAASRAQVDALRGYREAQRRVADELGRRQTEATELAEALTGLDEVPELPVQAPDDAASEDEEVQDPDNEKETQVPENNPVAPEAIAAGLTAADIAAARTPQTSAEKQPVATKARPKTAMVAATSQNVLPYGQEVSLAEIGRIAEGVKNNLRPVREVVRAYVASVPAYEETTGLGVEMLSKHNSLTRNDELIQEAVEAHQARRAVRMGKPVAQTAAICDPLDIIRDIPDYVSQADPLSAIFPSRPISRLGFNFTPAITLGAVSAGTQYGWDDADQALVNPTNQATWKPCYDVSCGSPCEVTAVASTACMTFDVTTEMSSPERVRDIMSKLTALRIRNRTIGLLDIMDGLSIQWTRTGDYSLLPDTIYAVNKALAAMTYPERLDYEDYTLVLPHGFDKFLASDVHGQTFVNSEDYNAGADQIVRNLATILGVDTVVLRDETDTTWDAALPAVATPTALNDAPCVWPLRLIHTPSAIYGSTGLIDTGIQSDPQLARQNKRQWFQEEFSLLSKHGSPPWAKITLTSAASGSRAAASTKLACA